MVLDEINEKARHLSRVLTLLSWNGDEFNGPNGNVDRLIRQWLRVEDELEILWDRRRRELAWVDAKRFKNEVDMRRGNREDVYVPPVC